MRLLTVNNNGPSTSAEDAILTKLEWFEMGNHPVSDWSEGVESLPTHDRSSLPPFPAPCPGTSRIHSALPCYTFPVPTAQHRYHIPAQADSARGRGKPETYGLG
ncbi:MAG: hypothetical protein E6J36_16720 [Chloroflexi bacterium]|nr:MAG: hypothetical protein E6J36_16720 [Chloroflexota bacterium]